MIEFKVSFSEWGGCGLERIGRLLFGTRAGIENRDDNCRPLIGGFKWYI